MTRVYLIFVIFLFHFNSLAQVLQPVRWTSEKKRISKNEYELILKARIEKNWYVYSSNTKSQDVGIPVSINFNQDKVHYKKIGSLKEIGKLKTSYMPDLGFSSHFFTDEVLYKQRIGKLSSEPFAIKVLLEFQACSSVNCLAPEKRDFVFYFNGAKDTIEKSVVLNKSPKKESFAFHKAAKKLWINIFFLGFLGGLLAVFMPCVFPIIPLTISFFTKKIQHRFEVVKKAILYGAFIVSIYLFLGIFVSLAFGASALNELSTNPWVNLLFFVLFVLFALSFFGSFEIYFPRSWIDAADKKARTEGLLSLFFMAFVLVLVSFSCTAPIIGTLLVEAAAGGSFLNPVVGMLGFSLGLSLPFVLFAVFPSALKALPRSGTWLQTLKISFGFIELALAMKFLSNADLVWQWHLIQREVFLVFWIVIFSLLGLYLLRIFTFSSDNATKIVGLPAFFAAVFSLSFSLYMLPGLFGAPLKLLSGFIPPLTYSEQYKDSSSALLSSGARRGPHGIPVFYNYDQGRSYAMSQLKPILLDFTGYACANCLKMEEQVWINPRIRYLLSQEMVVISLHVNDRKELPEDERYFSSHLGREINTYGQKWADFQVKYFKANAQPYYVMVGYDKQPMNDPIGVEFNVDKYIKWLESGVQFFASQNSF